MKLNVAVSLLIASSNFPVIFAHTRFTTLFVNGVSQGDGTCVRMDMNPSTTTGFVESLNSPDVACGKGGDASVNRTCPAKTGDSISLLHRAWADGAQPGFIDPSHKGPCAVYMRKMADTDSQDPWFASAAGEGWFKIFYDGYDEAAQKWCTEKMIENGGVMTATIPTDLADGYYLIRSEILSLQNVVNEHVNPQFYAGCAQVYVQGGSSVAVTQPETAQIPGYVSADMKATSFNIYKQPLDLPYPEFGPKAYTGSSTSPSAALGVRQESSDETNFVGSCPSNTVLEVGNWCGVELPSWSNDQVGALPQCWAMSQRCWDELDTCWNNLSPAVNAADKSVGCSLWDQKCQGIVDWCSAGNTQGPPNEGKVLTPPREKLQASQDQIVKRAWDTRITTGIDSSERVSMRWADRR